MAMASKRITSANMELERLATEIKDLLITKSALGVKNIEFKFDYSGREKFTFLGDCVKLTFKDTRGSEHTIASLRSEPSDANNFTVTLDLEGTPLRVDRDRNRHRFAARMSFTKAAQTVSKFEGTHKELVGSIAALFRDNGRKVRIYINEGDCTAFTYDMYLRRDYFKDRSLSPWGELQGEPE